MDKRILKTRYAIYDAFAKVLKEKPFSKITIEDILQQSKVSRSTFYSHFKTKEEVLSSISNHIFEHVFSHSLKEEKTHDFSKVNILDYSHLITHIFYHLHDEKELISAILSSESKDIFINNMKDVINPISNIIIKNNSIANNNLPMELSLNKVTELFVVVMDYWFKNNCLETPEKITTYFFELIK